MKLNLDDRNVFKTEMTMKQARDFLDSFETMPDDVVNVFDEAQGFVHSDEGEAWIVIKVK